MIKRLIDSIYASKLKLAFEVITITYEVDSSGVREYLLDQQLEGKAKVIVNREDVGKAESRNQGIRAAQGKYVYILDDDTEINGEAVEGIFSFMEANPRCGIASPKLLNTDKTVQASARRFPTIHGKILRNAPPALCSIDDIYGNYDISFKVDYLIGASQFVRREMFDKCGYMDPDSGRGVEDIEICMMAWEHGYEVWYVNNLSIFHHQSFAIKNEFFSRKTIIHFMSLIYFFKKYRYFFARNKIYQKLRLELDSKGMIIGWKGRNL